MANDASTPPDRARREDRMKDILNAAFEEFAAKGFEAARQEVIAQGAGVGKGTLYLYFPSKERLFEEVVRSFLAPVVDQVVDASADLKGPASVMLRRQIETIYRQAIATDRRRMLRLLIAEGPRFPHLLDLYFREVITRTVGALRRTIDYGVASGEFRETTIATLPPLLMGPALGGALWKMLFEERHPMDLDALCDAHVEMLLAALRR